MYRVTIHLNKNEKNVSLKLGYTECLNFSNIDANINIVFHFVKHKKYVI